MPSERDRFPPRHRCRAMPRRRFWPSSRGNVAILFGLAMVPLFGFVGAGLDYSRATAERSMLQAAADAAALADAQNRDRPQREIEGAVRSYLDANLPERYRGIPFDLEVLNDNTTLEVSLTGSIETSGKGFEHDRVDGDVEPERIAHEIAAVRLTR